MLSINVHSFHVDMQINHFIFQERHFQSEVPKSSYIKYLRLVGNLRSLGSGHFYSKIQDILSLTTVKVLNPGEMNLSLQTQSNKTIYASHKKSP